MQVNTNSIKVNVFMIKPTDGLYLDKLYSTLIFNSTDLSVVNTYF